MRVCVTPSNTWVVLSKAITEKKKIKYVNNNLLPKTVGTASHYVIGV